MKARIKKTGEIVNVAEYAKITLEQCDSWGDPVELSPDEVELIDESEQRIETPFIEALQHNFEKECRFKILVAAIPAVVERNKSDKRIAADACDIADAVFAEWQSRETSVRSRKWQVAHIPGQQQPCDPCNM